MNSSKQASQMGGIPPKCPPNQKSNQEYCISNSQKVNATKIKNVHSSLVRNGRYRHYDHLTPVEASGATRAYESARSSNRERKPSTKQLVPMKMGKALIRVATAEEEVGPKSTTALNGGGPYKGGKIPSTLSAVGNVDRSFSTYNTVDGRNSHQIISKTKKE